MVSPDQLNISPLLITLCYPIKEQEHTSTCLLANKWVYDATSKVCQEYKNNCILTDHWINCENIDLQKNTAVNSNVDINKWVSGLIPPN